MLQNVYVSYSSKGFDKCEVQGGLETASDLAAFRLSIIVPNFFRGNVELTFSSLVLRLS